MRRFIEQFHSPETSRQCNRVMNANFILRCLRIPPTCRTFIFFCEARTLTVSLTQNNGPPARQMEIRIMINHKLLKFGSCSSDLFVKCTWNDMRCFCECPAQRHEMLGLPLSYFVENRTCHYFYIYTYYIITHVGPIILRKNNQYFDLIYSFTLFIDYWKSFQQKN